MRPFAYAAPTTVTAAIAAGSAGAGTRFLAGGTTLYDLMKLDVETPVAVVDVSRIAELAAVDTSGDDELVIGAGARMSDVAEDPVLLRDYPALAESLAKAASQQLRTMATVGGNLLQRTRCAYFRAGAPFACNKREPGSGSAARGGLDRGHAVLGISESCIATYPGDWAVALLAFDGLVDVAGPAGERTLPVADLHREPGDTPQIEHALTPGELIVRIRIPVTDAGRASTYHKIRDRESYGFALASAAVGLAMDGDTTGDARIALGGVATRPWRARGAEQSLIGGPITTETARRAGQIAFADARIGRDNGYKVELGIRTVTDALLIAAQRGAR